MRIAGALAALLVVAHPAAQNAPVDVRSLPVQGFNNTGIHRLAGAGGNIAVQAGDEGVVLVDTGSAGAARATLAAIRRITDKPIGYIINTHAHPDHVGGNEAIVTASGGQRTNAGGGAAGLFIQNQSGVFVVAHQNVVDRMLLQRPGQVTYPEPAVARSSFITADKQLYFNGEAIQLTWHPNAHTDGDVLVYFPRSDVVVAGDIVQTATFPRIDADWEGRLQGLINGLNHVIDLAVPDFNQTGGTRIIPGHGWICTESDIVELRDMATIVRDRIHHLIQKGLTLEQIRAASPIADYAPVYSDPSWTTEQFLSALDADLRKPWNGPAAKSGLNFTDGGR
jgi:glyoxylase-like metal-dependent hydrolase (beta-lactamase superfamily II)